MTRRTELIRLPEGGFIVKVWAASVAEGEALMRAIVAVPPPHAFTPGLQAGEPFDAPEPMPPNCGLPPSGYAEPDVGAYLANAVHDLAEQPDDACTAVGCAVPIPDEH